MNNQIKAQLLLNKYELRELYRCINVCWLDKEFIKGKETENLFDLVKKASRRISRKEKQQKQTQNI